MQHGVERNADLDPALLRRETRPLRQRIREFLSEDGWVVLALTAFLILGLPTFADILFIFSFFVWRYIKSKRVDYRFRTPIVEKLAKNNKKKGNGIMFFGNDFVDGTGVWFSDDDLRTHMLVFGSTGSGKTRFLLGLMYQALLFGSGCIYVDGKGDNTVYWLVWSLCRRLGREDDLLIINYLTGGAENAGKNSESRLSNTTNPFAHGTSDQLRELIVGLMRDSGGDGDMWKGRASALLAGLLRCLVALRERGEIQLNVQTIRDYMPLDKVVELTRRTDLTDYSILPLRKYLLELPGYSEEDALAGDISPKAYEQHGYLTMQLTETLGDLGDTYGHIFNTPLGEVDFKDVVFNRRILFVMLPALEKSPDSLGNLGKLVVAAVRSALAPALGNKLEGTRRDVIEVKPTNTTVPFLLVLDEYGYYSVKGFAVVAAQARSLGIGVIFAGQDYPSFKKGSAEEAASVVANTNIKVCMKLEDPEETYQLFEKRAGKSLVTMTTGHEVKGAMLNYLDQNTTRIEEKMRINVRDLVAQSPGQAHVIFGDEMARCQLFYAVPHEVSFARLNSFLPVKGPSRSTLDAINGVFGKLEELFDDARAKKEGDGYKRRVKSAKTALSPQARRRTAPKVRDNGLLVFLNDYKMGISKRMDLMEAGIFAIGMIEYRNTIGDEELTRVINNRREEMTELARTESERQIKGYEEKNIHGSIDEDDMDAIRETAARALGDVGLIDKIDDPVKRALENLELATSRAAEIAEETQRIEDKKRDREISDEELKLKRERLLEEDRRRIEERDETRNKNDRNKLDAGDDVDDYVDTQTESGGSHTYPRAEVSNLDGAIQTEAATFSKMFEVVMNKVIHTNAFDDNEAFSPQDIVQATARNQLKAIEIALGRSEEEAEMQASRGMEMLSNTIIYPKKPVPVKESLKTIEESMKKLKKHVDEWSPGS